MFAFHHVRNVCESPGQKPCFSIREVIRPQPGDKLGPSFQCAGAAQHEVKTRSADACSSRARSELRELVRNFLAPPGVFTTCSHGHYWSGLRGPSLSRAWAVSYVCRCGSPWAANRSLMPRCFDLLKKTERSDRNSS